MAWKTKSGEKKEAYYIFIFKKTFCLSSLHVWRLLSKIVSLMDFFVGVIALSVSNYHSNVFSTPIMPLGESALQLKRILVLAWVECVSKSMPHSFKV